MPGNPNLLLVSPYPSTTLFVVPRLSVALGNITGTNREPGRGDADDRQFAQLDASTQSGFAASAGLDQLVR